MTKSEKNRELISFCFCLSFCLYLSQIEPKLLYILGACPTTELDSTPQNTVFEETMACWKFLTLFASWFCCFKRQQMSTGFRFYMMCLEMR